MVVPLDIIEHEIGKLKEYFVLIQTSRLIYPTITHSVIQHLTKDEESSGIYVIDTKPYVSIKSSLVENKLDPSKMVFIDMVSSGKQFVQQEKNVVNLENSRCLLDLGVAIDNTIKSLPKTNRFVFFDSLNQLLMHNSIKDVISLLQQLNVKVREEKLKCVAIIVEKNDLVDDICQFFDKVLSFR